MPFTAFDHILDHQASFSKFKKNRNWAGSLAGLLLLEGPEGVAVEMRAVQSSGVVPSMSGMHIWVDTGQPRLRH